MFMRKTRLQARSILFGLGPTGGGLSSGYLPISAVGVAGHIVEALRSVSGQFIHAPSAGWAAPLLAA